MTQLPAAFQIHVPMIEAITELFSPFVETAIHDLRKGELIAVYNNVSKRRIGDRTPLELLDIDTFNFPDFFPPYHKEIFGNRQFKCTSITVRDQEGTPIGLICFNFEVSAFSQMKELSEILMRIPQGTDNPVEKFGSDSEEQMTRVIDELIKEKGLHLTSLTSVEKKELVHQLYHRGVFNFKNSIPFVANYLNVSRPTIYNYLKSIGEPS